MNDIDFRFNSNGYTYAWNGKGIWLTRDGVNWKRVEEIEDD